MLAPSPASARRAWSTLAVVGLGWLLSACPRSGPGPDNPESTMGTTTEAEGAEEGQDADAAPEVQCGVDTRFDDYDWIPTDARLSTAVEREPEHELDAALAQLVAIADEPAHQLPIFAALDYRNLGLQLGTLDRLLASLDFDPSEVVELHSPGGDFVWLWPTDCPREVVAARVLERHGLMMRVDLDHPSQRRAAGSAETLPFDLLMLGERRVAMTLAGRGASIGAWLDGSTVNAGGSDDEGPPGELLAAIEPATIRSVLAGEALLTTGPDTPKDSPNLRKLRVTATDATLETPP